MNPRVSIILPYYNGQRWILKAIQSVQAQTGISWELIIVDDGSRLSPAPILHTLSDNRICLIRQENAGKGAALNRGITESHADFICFLDQDDIMLKGRLKRQLGAFAKVPHSDVVYSDYERVLDDGQLIDRFVSRQVSTNEALHQMAKGTGLLSMQNMMIRKSTILKIGGFSDDPKLTGLDDAEFLTRLLVSKVVITYEPGFVQQWVQHERNYSRSEQFQQSRLVLLDHLTNLSDKYPIRKKELSCFRFHAYYMRGLYFIENNMANRAIPELCRAISIRPLSWQSYYLLVKSIGYKLRDL